MGEQLEEIAAVVLAAGRSSRMGSPKALLEIDGEPALGRVARLCRDCGLAPVVVVLGFHADRIRREVSLESVLVVENPDPARGQTSSLQCGLAVLPEERAVCLFPVDHAFLRAATLTRLVEAWRVRPASCAVLVPSHAGRRGHPVVFSAAVAAELRALPPDSPAHRVIRRDPGRLQHLVSDDVAVLRDLDTPQDLERWRRE